MGSKVLILRPTNNNKLLMQWQGPFTITERVHGNDYQIDLNGKSRMYHTNMLKQYYERGEVIAEYSISEPELDEDMDYETAGAAILEPEEREEIELPLLEQGQTETYKDVDVNPELEDDKKAEVWKLLEENRDIF